MRAIRYHGPGDLRLETDVAEPQCLPHQVKIKPSFCGICGSDLHAYTSAETLPFKDKPHPVTGETWPVTFGHEFSGEIVEVGSGVASGLKIGDRVAVQPTICCKDCPPCQEGSHNNCNGFGFVGLSGWGGGMSDFVCVEAKYAHTIPDNIGLDMAALVEPLSVAWHAVRLSGVKPGDSALVMGAGPIGLAVTQCLKAQGADQIIVVEIAETRKSLAANFGADTVLDPTKEDVVARAKELCGGQGPQVALDCAGVRASIASAVQSVRYNGHVVNVAGWEAPVPFDFNSLVFGEKKISGSLGYADEDFASVIKALGSGLINVDGMITRKIKLDQVVEQGILALMKEKDTQVKIMIDVRA